MFKVNLKDLGGAIALPDKEFEGESMFEVETKVLEYIEANYPGSFPNPVTASRKIMGVIKNETGRTLDEQTGYENDEFMKKADAAYEVELELIKPVVEKYRQMRDESHDVHSKEISALVDEKYDAQSDEEKEAIQLKMDDLEYRHQQTLDQLFQQEYAETEAIRTEHRNNSNFAE